jgi:hypothetical protein
MGVKNIIKYICIIAFSIFSGRSGAIACKGTSPDYIFTGSSFVNNGHSNTLFELHNKTNYIKVKCHKKLKTRYRTVYCEFLLSHSFVGYQNCYVDQVKIFSATFVFAHDQYEYSFKLRGPPGFA